MALYSVRSDRQFCEQLDYNLLFRWFLDMNADEPTFDASSFSRNRDRLLDHDVAGQFFAAVVAQVRAAHLMSHDHFTVDGTLIEAMASLKSFRRKDENPEQREPPDDPGNPAVNFHGEKRSNETHQSKTDPRSEAGAQEGQVGERPHGWVQGNVASSAIAARSLSVVAVGDSARSRAVDSASRASAITEVGAAELAHQVGELRRPDRDRPDPRSARLMRPRARSKPDAADEPERRGEREAEQQPAAVAAELDTVVQWNSSDRAARA